MEAAVDPDVAVAAGVIRIPADRRTDAAVFVLWSCLHSCFGILMCAFAVRPCKDVVISRLRILSEYCSRYYGIAVFGIS